VTVVSDSSPLITLAKIRWLELLPQLASGAYVDPRILEDSLKALNLPPL
jgi:hypothetical protein